MKKLLLAAVAIAMSAYSTTTFAQSRPHKSWGAQVGASSNSPTDEFYKKGLVAGQAQDGKRLTGSSIYITNTVCGVCTTVNNSGGGEVNITVTQKGPVTGVQSLTNKGNIKQITKPGN